ncbi:hypothetical protein NC651_002971 [Populus alba x Populus x berolinensis]|nr:hypothetical protein NC651_002971 [Populus alba x Populus x berolinensis]
MAVGGAAKVGVFAPFPVKDQLPGVDSCVSSSPSWPKAILLGFQHYLVMLGTTVIIPSIFVLSISRGNVEKAEMINTLLFVAGINTLLQTWFGTRLPVVIGGPYAFSIPTITISLSTNNSTNVIFRTPRQCTRKVKELELTIIFLSHLWLFFLRFELSMKAVQGALVSLDSGDSLQASLTILASVPTIANWRAGKMCCNWNPGTPYRGLHISVCSSHDEIKEHHMQSVCCCSCMGICQQFWLWLVHIIVSIQTHNLAVVLIMLGSLVLLLVYWYNYCGIKIWECHSSASFCTQPWYWMAASAGLGFLQFCNSIASERSSSLAFLSSWAFLCHSTSRNTFWFLVVALSTPVPPGYFNDIIQVIFSSPATVAILVACFLDCTHSLSHITTRRDSGRYWWERFRYFSQDTRSEEFYTAVFPSHSSFLALQFDCQNASIHGRFRVLACDPGCLPVEGSIIFATTHKELHSHSV